MCVYSQTIWGDLARSSTTDMCNLLAAGSNYNPYSLFDIVRAMQTQHGCSHSALEDLLSLATTVMYNLLLQVQKYHKLWNYYRNSKKYRSYHLSYSSYWNIKQQSGKLVSIIGHTGLKLSCVTTTFYYFLALERGNCSS